MIVGCRYTSAVRVTILHGITSACVSSREVHHILSVLALILMQAHYDLSPLHEQRYEYPVFAACRVHAYEACFIRRATHCHLDLFCRRPDHPIEESA